MEGLSTWRRGGAALSLVAGRAQLEAAHLQHLATALAGSVQADALKGALTLDRPLGGVGVEVPASTRNSSWVDESWPTA